MRGDGGRVGRANARLNLAQFALHLRPQGAEGGKRLAARQLPLLSWDRTPDDGRLQGGQQRRPAVPSQGFGLVASPAPILVSPLRQAPNQRLIGVPRGNVVLETPF